MNPITDEVSLRQAISEALAKGARFQDLVILTGEPVDGLTFVMGIPVRHSKYVLAGRGFLFNERMARATVKLIEELIGLT